METLPGLEDFKKVSKKSKKTKETMEIGKSNYLNQTTGEVEEFTVIRKNVNKDFNFHKIWLEDLLNILNSFGNRKIIILSYLLKIMRNSDNSVVFTMRSLSKNTDISLQTCQTTINELIENNVLKRDKEVSQLYFFNPDIIIKGDSNKRQRLLIEYNFLDEKKDIKESKKLKENIKEITEKGKMIEQIKKNLTEKKPITIETQIEED